MSYYFRRLTAENAKGIQSWLMRNASISQQFVFGAAASIAYRLPLPTAAVKDVDDHYRHTFWTRVDSTIGKINEMLPHDIKTAAQLVQDLYVYRYSQAYPSKFVLATKPGSGIVDFFGVSSRLSEGWRSVLNDAPSAVTEYANGVTKLLDDLEAFDRRQEQVAA